MEHSIKGVILQPFHRNVIFEGHNVILDDQKLTGRLSDKYGGSSIEGLLDASKGVMDFTKIYDGRDNEINYHFENRKGIWVGTYEFSGAVQGEALCELWAAGESPLVNWENASRSASLSYGFSEEWSSRIIREMIDEGYLIENKDPETGESFILPSDNPPVL